MLVEQVDCSVDSWWTVFQQDVTSAVYHSDGGVLTDGCIIGRLHWFLLLVFLSESLILKHEPELSLSCTQWPDLTVLILTETAGQQSVSTSVNRYYNRLTKSTVYTTVQCISCFTIKHLCYGPEGSSHGETRWSLSICGQPSLFDVLQLWADSNKYQTHVSNNNDNNNNNNNNTFYLKTPFKVLKDTEIRTTVQHTGDNLAQKWNLV